MPLADATASDAVASPPPAPDYEAMARAEAKRQGVPEELVLGVLRRESWDPHTKSYNPKAVSSAGAEGLMQLMPDTARAHGVKNPYDPPENIRGGVSYIRKLLERHNGNQRLALASYNAGPGAVARYGDKIPPYKETQQYVNAIAPPELDLSEVTGPAPAQTAPAAASEGAGGPVELDLSEVAGPAHAPAAAPVEAAGAPPGPAPLPDYSHGMTPPSPRQYEPDPSGSGANAPGVGMLVETMDALDPTTPTGRRNLAGAAGGIGAGLLTGGLGPLAAGALSVLGAGVGGAAAEGGEQLVGTKPPDPAEIGWAGLQQGGYDATGQFVGWGARAVGNRAMASGVSQRAFQALKDARAANLAHLGDALDAAEGLLRQTKDAGANAIGAARTAAGGLVSRARESATRSLEAAQAHVRGQQAQAVFADEAARTAGASAKAAGQAAAEAPYQALAAKEPSAVAAGQAARQVIEGPAARARKAAGEAVQAAAESGPPVNIAKLKQQAQAIVDKEVAPSAVAFPRTAAKEAGVDSVESLLEQAHISPDVFARYSPDRQAAVLTAARESQAATRAALDEAQGEAAKDNLKHPIMGVIQRILQADDEVPFSAAHGFKRELDDALSGKWDQTERRRVDNMTMGLRKGLRATLAAAGHAPYEEATAASAKVARLFTKGVAPALKKAAVDEPEAVVRLISPTKPTKVRMLRELLTTTAAEGGGGAEGQAAWDGVRSAWTYSHVVKGGVDGLQARLDKLPADFVREMYGDDTGKAVLGNLRQISSAYTQAVAKLGEDTAGSTGAKAASREEAARLLTQTKRLGRAGVREAQAEADAHVAATETRMGRQSDYAADQVRGMQGRLADAKLPTPDEVAFQASSVAPSKIHSVEQVAADAARAVALGPTSIWGGISWMRLLRGPKGADMVRWAAYSPTNTRLLTNALNSPHSPELVSNLLRAFIGGKAVRKAERKPPAPGSEVGHPPPHPGEVTLSLTGPSSSDYVGQAPPPPH